MLDQDYKADIINKPIDVRNNFTKMENNYFIATDAVKFDTKSACGNIIWKRNARKVRMAFNTGSLPFEESQSWEFPPDYPQDYKLPFSIDFISNRTIRIRMQTKPVDIKNKQSIMLIKQPEKNNVLWTVDEIEGGVLYKSSCGSIEITYSPWHIKVYDAKGKLLTSTQNISDTTCLQNTDPMPFSFVRRVKDMKRAVAASFTLAPDEKIFGCGESFTRLNKRGQKIILYAKDPHGVQTPNMYKPVPFFMSSRGYGMFYHTSAPLTFDFGCTNDQVSTAYLGDECIDLFIFIGNPKDILKEYTKLTGRSPMPPLWSFGLWMSRITYNNEMQVYEVSSKLRENKIPCDVIHIDTGWFEKDWCCDYEFSSSRFTNPKKMISDMNKQGFKISLWQYPYITPKNKLFKEAIENGYAVLNEDGDLAVEDVVIDFSNPEAVKWYQGLIKKLLDIGIACIKVDFGEAAPIYGRYCSGKSGFYEHNLYPLRYNKAVAEITKKVTGNNIIWARSAWAGSQRYPVHWGGDADNTDCAMAASLRAGLSLGLCGFSFWSHDIGGFVRKSPEELYRRWLPFGMLSSHSRCHGAPPKEPWQYSENFMNDFRRAVELKYKIMPYIYAQAKYCSENGFPMLRTLFFEYPEDPGAWYIEDEYLFGSDILVAPIMEKGTTGRMVYLPKGNWIDYQTGKCYGGAAWHDIDGGAIPAVILIRDGAVIPHIKVSQCTSDMNFNKINFIVFSNKAEIVDGLYCNPENNNIQKIIIKNKNNKYILQNKELENKLEYNIVSYKEFLEHVNS